jgi:hypothetical protein
VEKPGTASADLPRANVHPAFANRRSRPKCMDRLPFASEGVLSEVADMYPAC